MFKNNVSIEIPPTQGIIFKDLFINNQDIFVDYFTDYYKKNQKALDGYITDLNFVLSKMNTIVSAKNAEKFKIAWNNFQKYVLLNNNKLEVLVAFRGQGGRDAEYSKAFPQEYIEAKGGIDTGNELVQETMTQVKASQVEEYLNRHLNGFIDQLYSKISSNEANNIHQYHNKFLPKRFPKDGHLTGERWQDIWYSNYYSGQGLGKAYDAFMNHIANHNKQVFNYLSSNGKNDNLQLSMRENKSVFIEEKGVAPNGNFAKLLYDSTNSISWYTGGDIIIVDKNTMQVVYNIQLKTTTRNNLSVFNIKIEKLKNFLKNFNKLSPEQKAKKIFKEFSTSISNYNEFEKVSQETIDEITKKGLGIK